MSSADATTLARSVLAALIEAGVREIVIAPGSRNAPLSFAAYDAAQAGLVRLHTRIDERSAAFLALGLTKGGSRAAVMCTSGTAVANLHPAVLEAAHAGVPLVVVTADRPARLRSTGANQTTDQVGIFGPLVATTDLADRPGDVEELWSALGPVHWNVQLDDPLTPTDRWTPAVTPRPQPPRAVPAVHETIDQSVPTVVVAGDDAGPQARRLAESAGWPLLAEPSSGSRAGAHAIQTYRLLLGTELGEEIERVVLFGHPTLSRPVSRLLARAEVVAVPPRGVWPEHAFPIARRLMTLPRVVGEGDPSWLERWQRADRSLASRVLAESSCLGADSAPSTRASAPTRGGVSGYQVAAAVARAVEPHGSLLVGPSNPIRDLDLAMAPYAPGGHRKVLANRGLAGIDGVVSTALGVALARPAGRALALMGDVTFLHDANGLVLGPDEPRPDLTIVVVNDDGGSIFATLEQGAEAYADRFERLFGTPHGVSIESLCAATRTPHLRVGSVAELEAALASPNGGVEVVEVPIDRAGRRDLDARVRNLRP